jgi:hypothetical protein
MLNPASVSVKSIRLLTVVKYLAYNEVLEVIPEALPNEY